MELERFHSSTQETPELQVECKEGGLGFPS